MHAVESASYGMIFIPNFMMIKVNSLRDRSVRITDGGVCIKYAVELTSCDIYIPRFMTMSPDIRVILSYYQNREISMLVLMMGRTCKVRR
jgi:hypothetical protein